MEHLLLPSFIQLCALNLFSLVWTTHPKAILPVPLMRACLHRLNHVLYSTFIQRCTARRPDPFVGTCLLDISFRKPVLLSHRLALLLTCPPRPFQSRIRRTKGLAMAQLPGSTASFDAYYLIHRNYGAFLVSKYGPAHSSSLNCFRICPT